MSVNDVVGGFLIPFGIVRFQRRRPSERTLIIVLTPLIITLVTLCGDHPLAVHSRTKIQDLMVSKLSYKQSVRFPSPINR